MIQRPIKRTPLKRKPRKKRAGADPQYLAFLHTQRCAVEEFGECGTEDQRSAVHQRLDEILRRIEAAHVGARGMAQKCPDNEAIPLCMFHHRLGASAHHQIGKNFWAFHGLNREHLFAIYQKRFEEREH